MFGIGYDLMKRPSTLQHVHLVMKQCGFAKYAVEILKRFNMLDCKFMATPMDTNLKLFSDETSEQVDMTHYRHIIGSLMYLVNTRPYICFDVNTLSQYLVKPIWFHPIVAKHVRRYLKGTIDLGPYYGRDHE